MKKRLKRMYDNSTFATKIRYSYLLLLVPLVLFLFFCFYHLWDINHNYESMLNSTVVAGEFSLDFKKDFDYETYLVIVENKTPEESKMASMLGEASRIVDGLERLTTSEDSRNYLKSKVLFRSFTLLGRPKLYFMICQREQIRVNTQSSHLES